MFVERSSIKGDIFAAICMCLFCVIGISCTSSHQSDEKTQPIALTLDDIKALITDDTLHYKVFVFYSPFCEPCQQHFKLTYAYAVQNIDTNKVKFYFVMDRYYPSNSGTINFDSLGISYPLYYLDDMKNDFSYYNENRWNNIANSLFVGQPFFDDLYGIPVNFIVNKRGMVKCCVHSYDDTLFRRASESLYEINDKIDKINFNDIDTIILHFKP